MKYIYYLILYYFRIGYFTIQIYFRKKSKIEKKFIVISVTSFGERINYRLILVLKSLLKQSHNVEYIHLALSKEDIENMPSFFAKFLHKNIRIKVFQTDMEFRSYNKYLSVLKHKPDYGFITVDDDIIYDYKFVYSLLKNLHRSNDNYVVCSRYHKKTYSGGVLNSYDFWDHCYHFSKKINDEDIFLTTGGGVYFPSNVISLNDFNWEIIKENFHTIDDVFINKLLEMKNIKKIRINNSIKLLEIFDPKIKHLNLNTYNTCENTNDIGMRLDLKYLCDSNINGA